MRYVTLASGRRRRWLWFIALQLGIVLVAVGAYLYRAYLDTLPGDGARSMCLLHDSLLCNPLSAYLAVGYLALDIRIAVAIVRGESYAIRVPMWYLWVLLIVAALYCIVRNVLMITIGYDYLGDLVRFWHV